MDGLLLERFVRDRDEAAFEALVARHGPMVLGVCRQVLGNSHDAEDAFQATFLVLARNAGMILKREVVGSWLHGVAYRIAARAKADAARRHAREQPVAEVPAVGDDQTTDRDWQELRATLHEEVNRLPEKYRRPIILCYLEGQTHEEAADVLGWPLGTVKGRLARARGLLQARLGRRDLAIPATECVSVLARDARVEVPPALVAATVANAVRFAPGRSDPGPIPPRLAALIKSAPRPRSIARALLGRLRSS